MPAATQRRRPHRRVPHARQLSALLRQRLGRQPGWIPTRARSWLTCSAAGYPSRVVERASTSARGSVDLRLPFVFEGDIGSSQLVATAIHAGHDLRPEVAAALALDESTRLREEDPFTDALISPVGARVVVNRSRFEVDLNRARVRGHLPQPGPGVGPRRLARPSVGRPDRCVARRVRPLLRGPDEKAGSAR